MGGRRCPRARRLSVRGRFWYAGSVKNSVSIVLFFLLSGFFLSALLGALEHSRKLLAIAGGCLVAVVCVIVFLTPVQLPSSLRSLGLGDDESTPTTVTQTTTTTGSSVTAPATSTVVSAVTSTVVHPAASTVVSGTTTTTAPPIVPVATSEAPVVQ
jgi:hypothetical protein